MNKKNASFSLRSENLVVVLWLSQILLPCAILFYMLFRLIRGPLPGHLLMIGAGIAAFWIVFATMILQFERGYAMAISYAPRLALCALSVGMASLSAEGLLRLSYFGSLASPHLVNSGVLEMPHPTRGWTPIPNQSAHIQRLDYSVIVDVDSKGILGRERAYEPAPGVFRTALLGDSFIQASQVDGDKSLPRQLERRLRVVNGEVVNLGVNGYGTAQELLYLKEEGLHFQPGLVVLAVFPYNDISNNSRPLQTPMSGADNVRTWARPYGTVNSQTGEISITMPDAQRLATQFSAQVGSTATHALWAFLKDRSVTCKLVDQAFRQRTHADPNILFGTYLTEYDPTLSGGDVSSLKYRNMWAEAWDITARLIRATKTLAEKNGAEFVIVVVPMECEVDVIEGQRLARRFPTLEFDMQAGSRRIVELAVHDHMHVLDLGPVFREAYERGGGPFYHHIGDMHWNAAGHQLAATALADYLFDNHLVPTTRKGDAPAD